MNLDFCTKRVAGGAGGWPRDQPWVPLCVWFIKGAVFDSSFSERRVAGTIEARPWRVPRPRGERLTLGVCDAARSASKPVGREVASDPSQIWLWVNKWPFAGSAQGERAGKERVWGVFALERGYNMAEAKCAIRENGAPGMTQLSVG